MTEQLKRANHFFSQLGKTVTSLIRIILISRFRNVSSYSRAAKNNKCIIIGNGPSFSHTIDTHLSTLENHDLICVNRFPNTEYFEKLRPTYYILGAPILFYPDKKSSPFYIAMRDDIFKDIRIKTTWSLTIFVPMIARKSAAFQALLKSNRNLSVRYYNPTPIEGFRFFTHYFIDRGLGMPRPHNVLIPAIINMMRLNYSEIFIIGADHSWLSEISVNDANEALVNQKHFYDENDSKPQKMEDYIHRPRRLHEIIHKFYLSFKSYWEIASYAKQKRIKIYNSSAVSMIDAFERMSLENIPGTKKM